MADSEAVYQHFRKSEAPFVAQVLDWIEQATTEYRAILTDFLDPRQAYILQTLIGEKGELKYHFNGGYNAAERQRALIAPTYFEPEEADFEIQLFEIRYPIKFAQLSHGKILGTLVNAGIDRNVFGDIMTDGQRWQFFVTTNLADYVVSQITKIGKVTVHLEEQAYTELIIPKDAWQFEQLLVSSFRLDTIIAAVYNMSRQRAKELVQGNKVKLNWQAFDKPDFELDLLDIISVRGYGRIQLKSIDGQTRKEKYRVTLGILRK